MTEKSVSNKLTELFDLYKSGAVSKDEYELLKSEIINQGEIQPSQAEVHENEQNHVNENEGLNKTIEEDNNKEISVHIESKESEKDKPKKKGLFLLIIITCCLICLAAIIKFFVLNDKEQRRLNEPTIKSSNKSDDASLSTNTNNLSNTFEYEVYDTYRDRNDPFLNIRNGIGSEFEIVFKLSDGEKINILESGLGQDGKWVKIHSQSKNQIGYANSRYIRKIDEQKGVSLISGNQDSNIDVFLNVFAKEYKAENIGLNVCLNSEVSMIIITNPGSMGMGNESSQVKFIKLNFIDYNISNQTPDGSMCEGFPDSKDGIYYSRINQNDLPVYSPDGVNLIKYSLPQKYASSSEIIKALVIDQKEYKATFYFAKINGVWYLICQDFCDCSG
jgi:hypothetical protein